MTSNIIETAEDVQRPLTFHTLSLISVNNNPHALSKVYISTPSTFGEAVVIKKYKTENLCMRHVSKIENEILLLQQLSHHGIMNFLSTFVSDTNIVYVMPLMECGSCKDLIMNNFTTGLPECWISKIVKNVIDALKFIHKEGIVHRAIRTSHIMLNQYGDIKLTGFRYAFKNLSNSTKIFHDFPYDSTPNLKWLSPEILKQDTFGYTEKSDVYSLGMTICELTNGIPPFENLEPKQILMQKLDGVVPLIFDSSTYPQLTSSSNENLKLSSEQLNSYLTKSISDSLHSLKNICCITNFNERPSVDELLDHVFFYEMEQSDSLLPPILPSNNFRIIQDNSDVESPSDSSISWNF